MEQIIMYIMAAGVILGGLDRIFGNKKVMVSVWKTGLCIWDRQPFRWSV